MRALVAASMQQRMMVAGFTCHDARQYNAFVLGHRSELIQSDATLLAFFKNGHGGEAAYHTYKTHLANRAALASAQDGNFCARVENLFSYAGHGSLSEIVDSLNINDTGYEACQSRVITASADRPFRDAAPAAAPSASSAPVRVADATTAHSAPVPDQVAPSASAGVPDQTAPRALAAVPQQAAQDRDDDADQAPPSRTADIEPPRHRRHHSHEEMNRNSDTDEDADHEDGYREGWRQADRGYDRSYDRGWRRGDDRDEDDYRDGPNGDDEDDYGSPYDDAPPPPAWGW